MNAPELSTLSLQAFAAVLGVLSLLALAVQLLTSVFRAPAPTAPAADRASASRAASSTPSDGAPSADDPFVHAAVQAAVRQVAPDAVVGHVAPVDPADTVEEEPHR